MTYTKYCFILEKINFRGSLLEEKSMDVSEKRNILDKYLETTILDKEIIEKINLHSFHTKNFVYTALRIGNNIGDPYEIAMDITFLEAIAEKFDLIVDTTEHPELHTKNISEKQLDKLVKAALIFENRNSTLEKQYTSIKRQMKDILKKSFNKLIS